MQKFTHGIIDFSSDFWVKLIKVGINEDITTGKRRSIKSTNIASVFTAGVIFAFIPVILLFKTYMVAALLIANLLCLLSALALNFLGYQRMASHAYLLVTNVFVLLIACTIGYQAGLQDFFYFTFLLPFLLFSVKDYKHLIAGGLTSVICYYGFQYAHPYFAVFNLSIEGQTIVYGASGCLKFAFIGAAVYMHAYRTEVAEKELTISDNKLEEKSAILARSHQDLEQFAYLISHDLKAPVRNLASFMKLLSTRYSAALPPDGREFVNMSLTGAERLAKQIDDMLTYYRVDRNLQPATEVDLNEMVKTITMELKGKITEANVAIVLESGLPLLKDVHPNMIYYVFHHLIGNGIKFNVNPEPKVEIGFTDEGDMIRFCIKDNGIGIDNSHQSKLFKMFKRLHTNDKYEGTGIGLALSKKIINFYQGDIWFESTEGKGSAFYFTVPKQLTGPVIPKLTEITHVTGSFVSKAA